MKILHFVDTTITNGETYVPAKNVNLVEIFNSSNLKVWFSNSDTNIADHNVQVGVTAGTADEALLAISEQLIDTGIHSHGVVKITAGGQIPNSYGFGGAIASVEYTAGT
jgi:hypothetical protein